MPRGLTDQEWQRRLDIKRANEESVIAHWKKNGIEVRAENFRWPDEDGWDAPPAIQQVRLPLEPAEWADVLNKYGEYLGSCCAQISHMRDLLQTALREDGWMEVEVMHDFVDVAEAHGFDASDPQMAQENPILRIIALWNQIASATSLHHRRRSTVDPNDPEHAISALTTNMLRYLMNDLFSAADEEQKRQMPCMMRLALHEMIPGVRALYHRLKELDPPEADEGGWVICMGDEVLSFQMGRAFFGTQKRAHEVALMVDKEWNPEDKTGPITVRRAHVSLEDGIQVEKEGEAPNSEFVTAPVNPVWPLRGDA